MAQPRNHLSASSLRHTRLSENLMERIRYPLSHQRLKTREVSIGNLKIGGTNPICIQSMLTVSVQETQRCLQEIQSLCAVNCELIRLTIPTRKDLDAVPRLKESMRAEGIIVPLVADIHFSPSLAVDACELFEKVRINPGNYSDKPKNSRQHQRDHHFEEGKARLSEAIRPLVANLNKYNRALRIGVNQGSLSTRMMERYGNSPLGMVWSALELIQLFEQQGFNQLVVSLKSSNPIVVQKAYRLLVKKQEGRLAVPLHLGVTEAGDGLMGRIKSLAGIGPLLMDGIGDTIRVSLTEPGANEIRYARSFLPHILPKQSKEVPEPETWERDLNQQRVLNAPASTAAVFLGEGSPVKIGQLDASVLPFSEIPFQPDFVYYRKGESIRLAETEKPLLILRDLRELSDETKMDRHPALLIDSAKPLFLLREYFRTLTGKRSPPVGFWLPPVLGYAMQSQLAAMLSEGLLDFILIAEEMRSEDLDIFFCLLQATRSRILVTDYIVCPSCGRTLFDIQKTSSLIKNRTSHLKGLKIGVMGCIVNGPGEMADADFGYVGSGPGKVDLYYHQDRVCRGIDENEAVERLVELIKEKGFWVD